MTQTTTTSTADDRRDRITQAIRDYTARTHRRPPIDWESRYRRRRYRRLRPGPQPVREIVATLFDATDAETTEGAQ